MEILDSGNSGNSRVFRKIELFYVKHVEKFNPNTTGNSELFSTIFGKIELFHATHVEKFHPNTTGNSKLFSTVFRKIELFHVKHVENSILINQEILNYFLQFSEKMSYFMRNVENSIDAKARFKNCPHVKIPHCE